MKKILRNLQENWITYGFETLVVVVGILGAFALNNWRDANANREKAIHHLEGIVQDLQMDTVVITEGIRWMDRFMWRKLKILNTTDYSDLSTDELCNHGAGGLGDFVITDIAFSKIENFDLFDVLDEEQLISEVIRYYTIEKNHHTESILWDRDFIMHEEKITKISAPYEVLREGVATIQSEEKIREDAIRFLESPAGRNIVTHFLWRRDILKDGFQQKKITTTELLVKVQAALDEMRE